MPNRPLHLILISAQQFSTEAKVMGLGSGADDYITSPFEPAELLARLRVGERMLRLHLELRKKICELQKTSAEVRQLQGLLPICMDCKKIRDDNNYWHQVEHYIRRYADVSFTHSICPACFQKRKAAMSLAKPPPFLDPAPKDEVERVSGVSPVTG
jgi:response regulator RpfG family c-di-GMP phosphodiesterase